MGISKKNQKIMQFWLYKKLRTKFLTTSLAKLLLRLKHINITRVTKPLLFKYKPGYFHLYTLFCKAIYWWKHIIKFLLRQDQ